LWALPFLLEPHRTNYVIPCMEGYIGISGAPARSNDTTRLIRRRSLDKAKLLVVCGLCVLWGACFMAVLDLSKSRYGAYPPVQNVPVAVLLLAVTATTFFSTAIAWSARIMQDTNIARLLARLFGYALLIAVPWTFISFAVRFDLGLLVNRTGNAVLYNVAAGMAGAPVAATKLLGMDTYSLPDEYVGTVVVLLLIGALFALPRMGLGSFELWTMSLLIGSLGFMFGAFGVPGTIENRLNWCIVAGVVGCGTGTLVRGVSIVAEMRKHGLGWEHWEAETARATPWAASGAIAAIAGLLLGSGLIVWIPPVDPWFYNVKQDLSGAIAVILACGVSALVVGIVLGRTELGVEQMKPRSPEAADTPRRRRVVV
jgi:hypothetical protein